MKALLLMISLIILALTSCEGFIHLQGYVVDNHTEHPVANVQVFLILRGKDTITANKLQYDTISFDQRNAMRKKGIKDDYKMHDAQGFSKRVPSFTDSAGFFRVGDILTGCVSKCPGCQLLFRKEGYKPFVLQLNSIFADSISISLQQKK